MKAWTATRCRRCRHEEVRYCNVKRCRACGGPLERIAPPDRLILAKQIVARAKLWAAHILREAMGAT